MKKYNLLKSVFFILLLAASFSGTAQHLDYISIPFKIGNQNLKNAMAGGFNDPQFSEVDLNDDGILDLFVFDRIGNAIATYLNGGTANQVDYSYAPEFAENFPNSIEWVLLRDYNMDGIMDVFSASTIPGVDGVEVYRGRYENGKIAFDRLNFYNFGFNIIPVDVGGDLTNLYVSGQDVPAIDDIDGDGDLDIFSFAVSGGYIYHYDNQSVEMGFGADSLRYTLKTNCLGGVYESGLISCLCLPEAPGACCDGLTSNVADTRHAGSTLVTFDHDGDGDKELVLGDLSFPNMVMLINTGSDENVFYGEQDCSFPSYDVPVDLPIFPAGFYLDVNNDGKKDFLAAPNASANGEDYFCSWYYQNIGTANNPVFEYKKNDFLVEDMLDMGSGAHPTFVDYNQDGLLDLVVGNVTYYEEFGERDARLFLYENQGTATAPSYKLINDDYLNFSQYQSSFYDLAPAFGDLDNDGDLDLVVGGHTGILFFVENIAGAGNAFSFDNPQPNYKGIDVGKSSTPQIVDLDRDGLPDLLIGETNGNINFMKNIGTPSNPDFQPDEDQAPNIAVLGGVDTRFNNNPTGHSCPIFLDFDGEYMLFTGSEFGKILRYTNIDGNLDGNFTKEEVDGYGDNIRIGSRVFPAIADLDNDDVLDMLIGNSRGGLNGFKTNLTTEGGTVSTHYINQQSTFRLYPNPVSDQLTIAMELPQNVVVEINIYNAVGQLIEQRETSDRLTYIEMERFAAGLYICELNINGNVSVERFVVQ